MNKTEKAQMISELADKFGRAKAAIALRFSKLDVATVTRLRKKFRDGGVDYKVIKNTLAKRAAKGTSIEQVSADFVGPVALAISYGDVIAPAKILTEFIKDLETIQIQSAVIDGKRIDAKGVVALAKMPGLTELRGKILGMLAQPPARLVRTLAAPSAQLVRVVKAREEALGKK